MDEKREYYRIDKQVQLQLRPVDAFTANNGEAHDCFDNTYSLSLLAQYHELDQQAQGLLKEIRASQPAIARYLQNLNKKFELLNRELVALQRQNQHGEKELTPINLSEGGLSFASDKALYKDSFVALRLVFLPEYTGVVLFAKVVRCEQQKSDTYHIAAKFHRSSELQQQMLARQILLWQQQSRVRPAQPIEGK